jgi:hypothetical protein
MSSPKVVLMTFCRRMAFCSTYSPNGYLFAWRFVDIDNASLGSALAGNYGKLCARRIDSGKHLVHGEIRRLYASACAACDDEHLPAYRHMPKCRLFERVRLSSITNLEGRVAACEDIMLISPFFSVSQRIQILARLHSN